VKVSKQLISAQFWFPTCWPSEVIGVERQPQFFWKRKTTSIFLKIEDNLNFLAKQKTTSIYFDKMKGNLNYMAKLKTTPIFGKTTSILWKWKTASIFWQNERLPHFFWQNGRLSHFFGTLEDNLNF
jgi:hypothetical protein